MSSDTTMPVRKRLSSTSPRKGHQVDITSFTSKRVDNNLSPRRSYAQAVTANPYEVLSEDDVKDEAMADAESCNSSEATQKTDNAQVSQSSTNENEDEYQPHSLKKMQRKIAKVARTSSKHMKGPQVKFLSSVTKATLERARRAEERLQSTDSDFINDVTEEQPNNSDATQTETRGPTTENDNFHETNSSSNQTSSIKTGATTTDSSLEKTSATDHTSTTMSSQNSSSTKVPQNPYQPSRKNQDGILYAVPQRQSSANNSNTRDGSIDKPIELKKGMLRQHIHRYMLRIKIISSKSEEDEQALVQKTLQIFFDIILQGDSKSIIPPYFELDRSDKSIPDLSSTFKVESLNSYYSLKRYFSRLSPRSEEGFVWSRITLAQSIPYSTFMEKTRHSLEKQSFSLWPKASDHELATDLGWLLYSTRLQEEVRITELVSSLTGEKVGAKWKAIRTTDGSNRNKDSANTSRVYAIHLECAADRAQATRQQLSKWYGSSSKKFPPLTPSYPLVTDRSMPL
jgi:hypothetical protein